MTREEEKDAVSRVLGGDSNAFEALVLDNQDKVYNLALRIMGNEQDAFDMSQEAFLRAYTYLESYRGESKFSVWLYRLTSNVCIDELRKRKRRETVSLSYQNEEAQQRELEIPDLRWNPETEAERQELAGAVKQGLMSLTPAYRQILMLREISGLSYEEIGQVLKLEEGTVKSRIFRARKKLCAVLSAQGNLSGENPSEGQRGV